MIPLAKSKEVQAAEAGNIPVVALESTIITHGLPWPKNLETALLVEETVRAAGAGGRGMDARGKEPPADGG